MTTKQKMPSKIRSGWSPTMERRAGSDEAKQVKCLISSEGHVWMKSHFDKLPRPVRKRLSESAHNICAACVWEEAQEVAPRPSLTIYLAVIGRIERQLDQS
jgi:hypothetical protein